MSTAGEWQEYVSDSIWVREYPIRYFGMNIRSRVTVVRLSDGTLFIHSPCEMDAETSAYIGNLGRVTCIVAPGSYHFSYGVKSPEFSRAKIFISNGSVLTYI